MASAAASASLASPKAKQVSNRRLEFEIGRGPLGPGRFGALIPGLTPSQLGSHNVCRHTGIVKLHSIRNGNQCSCDRQPAVDKQPDLSDKNCNTMRTNNPLFNLVPALALCACFAACAGTTNLFDSIESAAVSHGRLQGLALPRLPTCALRSTNQDPEGNWGATSGGLLLSLRFEKPVYETTEPVNAIVILRNATNSEVRYRECALADGSSREIQMSAVEFLVTNDTTHTVMEAKRIDTVFQHHESFPLRPLQQTFYVHPLDQFFKLEPGNYSVQARTRLIVGLATSSPPLASGVAHFTVVAGSGNRKGRGPSDQGRSNPPK